MAVITKLQKLSGVMTAIVIYWPAIRRAWMSYL